MFVIVILNQLLDVACNVLVTAMEVGGIGTMKLGMGNIILEHCDIKSQRWSYYGSLKLLAYCFHIISGASFGHTVAEIMMHTIYVIIYYEKRTITSQMHYCEHSLS